MKKLLKKIVTFLVIIFTFIFIYPDNVSATTIKPSQDSRYNSYEYVIDSYDIDIKVNENNTFDITETIVAYFNQPKHGIYRNIPLKNTIKRLDGTTSTNRAKITNVKVSEEASASKSMGEYSLQIGSEDKTITKEHAYKISYNYDIGKDPVKDYDELYYNIIGDEWDTVIGNVTFKITMPKEFDSSKLGFSSGLKGSTNNENITYNVSDKVIEGSYDAILSPGEALTVRTELEEGYFVGAGHTLKIGDYLIYLVPILFLAIAILLWHKYGKDNQVIETVEFYPPEGLNSLEVGFLYKGYANNTDVTSLLIYLANKKYIKIVETEKKSLFSNKKDFKIIKLKDYDGDNKEEKLFLKGLFKNKSSSKSSHLKNKMHEGNDTSEGISEVTSSDLYDKFYITMETIIDNINDKKSKIFEIKNASKSSYIKLMIFLTFLIITIPPILSYGNTDELILVLLFPSFGFTFLFLALIGGETNMSHVNKKSSLVITKIFYIISGLFALLPGIFFLLPALLQEKLYLIGYLVGLGCILGLLICHKYLPKRTPYGNEMLGKIRGFRNFLKTAEKDRLEAMVMQDPSYFYNILPYTYVLGVSDKWIKKFETISLQAPTWYDNPNNFNITVFENFINNTMTSAQNVMSSSPTNSSSGSGFSGGGSSGGGSGGGGGGSW